MMISAGIILVGGGVAGVTSRSITRVNEVQAGRGGVRVNEVYRGRGGR